MEISASFVDKGDTSITKSNGFTELYILIEVRDAKLKIVESRNFSREDEGGCSPSAVPFLSKIFAHQKTYKIANYRKGGHLRWIPFVFSVSTPKLSDRNDGEIQIRILTYEHTIVKKQKNSHYLDK
jgi:hypothetical protein